MTNNFSPADTGSAASRATSRLKAALILISVFLVAEIVGTLLADAAHMGTNGASEEWMPAFFLPCC